MQFGDFPEQYQTYENARVALLPVPFDKTCSWMSGAFKGPRAIVEASPFMEYYDIETGEEVYKEGIHVTPAIIAETSEDMNEQAYKATKSLLADKKFIVPLGGEHSISYPVIKAFHEKYPAMSVLHLDAHGDTRDEYEGSKFNHACVMARVREHVKNVVAVGLRSVEAEEMKVLTPSKTFFACHIHDNNDWIEKAVNELRGPVYVSIDVDVFDPSELPATGTPEPGGLHWYQVLKLLWRTAQKHKIIGFDVVELSPTDHKASDLLAARLIYTFLSYIHHEKAWGV